eukprot:TRINITY_DN2089_c0_g1_i1.p1 TRINITY_DN2089_c0_g1~~TRINITY_DN2089_c0_g1_i1.p1  ORF type:complete len:929 (+),score=276.79 TRINITY_DN2089_c0_g1_i1:100-2886(+)
MASKSNDKEQVPSAEDLEPVTGNPEQELKASIERITKLSAEEWEGHISAITIMRRVIIHNASLLADHKLLRLLVLAILDGVDNLRSLVSRNAIACVGDMFTYLGKYLDSEVDLVLPRMFKKYADSNKFIEEDLDKAIPKSTSITPSKSMVTLMSLATHKNSAIRAKVSFAIARVVTSVMGANVLKFKDLTKLLSILCTLASDASTESRSRAKQTIYAIYNYTSESEFEKMILKLTAPETKALKDLLLKMKKDDEPRALSPPAPEPKSLIARPKTKPSPSPSALTSKPNPAKSPAPGLSHPPIKKTPKPATPAAPATPATPATLPPEEDPDSEEYEFRVPVKGERVLGGDMEENIKVAVRIRPMTETERRETWKSDQDTVFCTEEKTNRIISYSYDHVYGKDVSNTSTIYEEVGAPIIESVLTGYNGTIFAYGQTSSGKTYTMMGGEDNPGIIPNAIQHVFDYIKSTPEREFLLRVSYLEIYNEVINDLLRPEGSNLNIREDKKRGIYIEHLKEEIVVSPEHVMHVINSGESHRHVASTDYNLISSRSHTIFRMIIESNLLGDTDGKSVFVSALTLIDLAGSEKVVSTSLLRRREGAYINKSLLTLGSIVSKLSERKKGEKIGHLPYRDSKLTRVLEPSLSGNAHIAIIATVTAAWANFEESHNTLKFSSRAKKVQNKVVQAAGENDKVLLTKYKREIEELKERLEVALEAEEKLKVMEEKQTTQTSNDNQEAEELRKELAEQETLRVALEEKIKHLTKLILVSSSVPHKRDRARTGAPLPEFNRVRSFTFKPHTAELTNLKAAVQADEGSSAGDGDEHAEVEALERVNEALSIKIDALQAKTDLLEKQMLRLKKEIAEKDHKLEDLQNVSEVKDKLDLFKKFLVGEYAGEVERLESELEQKDTELELYRADNKLLQEQVARNPKPTKK